MARKQDKDTASDLSNLVADAEEMEAVERCAKVIAKYDLDLQLRIAKKLVDFLKKRARLLAD
jgi:hypothetical protein